MRFDVEMRDVQRGGVQQNGVNERTAGVFAAAGSKASG
jgi:hypothetical protein